MFPFVVNNPSEAEKQDLSNFSSLSIIKQALVSSGEEEQSQGDGKQGRGGNENLMVSNAAAIASEIIADQGAGASFRDKNKAEISNSLQTIISKLNNVNPGGNNESTAASLEILAKSKANLEEKIKTMDPEFQKQWNEKKDQLTQIIVDQALASGAVTSDDATKSALTILQPPEMILLSFIKSGDVNMIANQMQSMNIQPSSSIRHSSDETAYPLLHWATLEDKPEVIKFLIQPDHYYHQTQIEFKEKADVNCRNPRGETPIMWGCIRGHVRSVSTLISNGAVLNIADGRGFSPMHHAAQHGQVIILAVLHFHGLPVDLRDTKGRTPLHWAVYNEQNDAVSWLLDHGADPAAEDWEKCLGIHWAALRGFINIAQTLLTNTHTSLHLLDRKDVTGATAEALATEKALKELDGSETRRKFLELARYLSMKRGEYVMEQYWQNSRSILAVIRNKMKKTLVPKRLPHFSWFFWPILAPIGWWQYTEFVLPATPQFYYTHLIFMICYWSKWFFWISLQMKDPGNFVIPVSEQSQSDQRTNQTSFHGGSGNGNYNFQNKSKSDTPQIDIESGKVYADDQSQNLLFLSRPNPLMGEDAVLARQLYRRVLTEGLQLPVCTTCEIVKIPRSKHDRVTNVCVDKFDHFCPWMNAAIGRRNYLDFMLTAICASLAMTAWLVLVYSYTANYSTDGFFSNISKIGYLWELWAWFFAMFAMYALLMTGQHLYLIRMNLSTNEMINRYRYKYLRGRNMFSQQSSLMNALEVFGLVKPIHVSLDKYYEQEISGKLVEATDFQIMDENQHHGHSHNHGHSHGGRKCSHNHSHSHS